MAAGAGSGCLLAGSRPRRAGSGLPSWGRRRPAPGLPCSGGFGVWPCHHRRCLHQSWLRWLGWVWCVAASLSSPPPLAPVCRRLARRPRSGAPSMCPRGWALRRWGRGCAGARPAGGRTCLAVLLCSSAVGARSCWRSSRWWSRLLGCAATLAGGGDTAGTRPSAAWLCCSACRWWVRGRGGCARSPSVGAGWRARRGVPGPLDPGRECGTGESLGLLLDQ